MLSAGIEFLTSDSDPSEFGTHTRLFNDTLMQAFYPVIIDIRPNPETVPNIELA